MFVIPHYDYFNQHSLFPSSPYRLQHNQNSGMGCRRRPDGAPSPTPSDTSDSDISLGTHSPVPGSLHLQHSPGSTSNGANDRDESLSIDDDKPRDLSNSLTSNNLPAYPTASLPPSCLPSFKLDAAATSLFNAGYLQSFANFKEMTQQFPIQPMVIRPHPQLPQALAGLNGAGNHLHPNYASAAYVVDCSTAQSAHPPKIRVNSPEKLNLAANSIAATLTAAVAHHPHHLHLQQQQQHQHQHHPPSTTAQSQRSSSSPNSVSSAASSAAAAAAVAAATTVSTPYHHSAQFLHRPFSTSPDIVKHSSAPEIT